MKQYACLHFLNAGTAYDMTVLRKARTDLRSAHYTTVLACPLQEMLDTTPEGLAWALYFHTTAKPWHDRLRRAVRPGDCFTYNNSVWAFIPAHDAEQFEDGLTAALGGRDDLPLKIIQIS